MHKLIDYTCDKLEDIERKVGNGQDLSMTELQYADTLAHLKKSLMKIEEMDGGYSNGYYDDGRSYGDHSYARRRDRMGRYSSRGYSMGGDEMVDELHKLMKDVPDEQTRKEFQRFINKIESM